MDKDILKETIKVEMEFLKLLFILIVGVATGDLGLALKETFGQHKFDLIILISGAIFLIAIIISFTIVLFRIINYLKQLKTP